MQRRQHLSRGHRTDNPLEPEPSFFCCVYHVKSYLEEAILAALTHHSQFMEAAMKVTVKLTKGEKKKLARLKQEARRRQGEMERAYAAMERAWKRGKAPAKISKAMQATSKKAQKAVRAMAGYYGKLKQKFPR